jgi:hypothetical protein
MKINNYEVSDIKFIARDEVTNLKFGGRINFRGQDPNYETQTEIYFSHIGELEDVIKILTDMYEMAMEHRDKWTKEET